MSSVHGSAPWRVTIVSSGKNQHTSSSCIGCCGAAGIRGLHEQYGLNAVSTFPAGFKVPLNDKKMYPFYALCVELDIPICITTGVPGPRVPMLCQKTELLDEVCWFFPELKIVMRHGAEPWDELAVKLMLKWPNLYYST
jgi:predicted TIM-barrel fold metal-dependent hydrolase